MSNPSVITQAYLNENSGGRLIGISIVFAVLTTVFIGLRYHARRFTGNTTFYLDDAFLLTAYVINLGMCALGIVMVKVADVGRHIEYVEATAPGKVAKWAQCIFAFEIIYFSSVAFPKLSVLALYLRVFAWRGPMRWATLFLMAVIAATGLSLVITACLQCRPIAFFWDRKIPGGWCINIQAFFHASSIPQFVLDFFVMALPLKTIWDLKLPTLKRIALLFIFMVASFGAVSSIIRAITFFGTSAFTDETFASVDLVGWSTIETGTYIVAACLPHLRPLCAHYTPQFIKDAWHRTVVTASSSIARSRGAGGKSTMGGNKSGFADDEIELTRKSMMTRSSSGARTIIKSPQRVHGPQQQQEKRELKGPRTLSRTRSLGGGSFYDSSSGEDTELEGNGLRRHSNTIPREGQQNFTITVTNEVTVKTENVDGTLDTRSAGGSNGDIV